MTHPVCELSVCQKVQLIKFQISYFSGKLIASSKKKDRNALDLGDLLGRSKDGFQPLNTDDAEVLSSDSEDLDDFKVPAMQA